MPKEKFSELIEAKEEKLNTLKQQTEYRIRILRNLNSALKESACMFHIVIRKSDEIPYEALYWREAQFFKGGRIRNGFLNAADGSVKVDEESIWRWVNGYVICNPRSTASSYVIQKEEGIEYLLVQWKSGDNSFGGDEPFWYVFKR